VINFISALEDEESVPLTYSQPVAGLICHFLPSGEPYELSTAIIVLTQDCELAVLIVKSAVGDTDEFLNKSVCQIPLPQVDMCRRPFALASFIISISVILEIVGSPCEKGIQLLKYRLR